MTSVKKSVSRHAYPVQETGLVAFSIGVNEDLIYPVRSGAKLRRGAQ